MKIKIEKEKAIKREKIMRLSWLFFGTIIWFLSLNGIFNGWQLMSFNEDFGWKFSYLIYSFIFMVLWEYVCYRLFLIEINSLKYEFDEKENRLIGSWKVILKHKDTARLQIVNSVNIDQDIWDKFVDTYSLSVRYGFSGEGYNYCFNYLSEKEAERILPLIKSSGKVGVELK